MKVGMAMRFPASPAYKYVWDKVDNLAVILVIQLQNVKWRST